VSLCPETCPESGVRGKPTYLGGQVLGKPTYLGGPGVRGKADLLGWARCPWEGRPTWVGRPTYLGGQVLGKPTYLGGQVSVGRPTYLGGRAR
jgi:hypothetical protein